KPLLYKPFFYFLRSLIYGKRLLLWLGSIIGQAVGRTGRILIQIVGIKIYRIFFNIYRTTGPAHQPIIRRFWNLTTNRGSLQIIFFIFFLIISVPHSTFYKTETNNIAGRQTILYQLLGPGDQDFSLEEINIDFTTIVPKQTQSWNAGAVSLQTGQIGSNPVLITNQDISSISLGGTAVSKPTIIPGATLPSTSGTGRSSVVEYIVQPGDTIGQISEQFNISLLTVLWANNLTTNSYIRPGDKLKILPVSGLLHVVKKGETISKIATTYKAEVDKIIEYNRLKEGGTDIVVGEELLIPDGTKPQSVSTVRKVSQFNNVSAPPSITAPVGSTYLWPSSVRYISQYYGWRHTGLDIAGPIGTPLYATKSGRVIRSQCGWNGGYGCYIIIDHGNGVQSLYGHASRLFVGVGDDVVQGKTIAAMGSTGRSTGSHLHFEIRINGVRVNPLKYIR
ncbi:MAG TPA: peptidoglycan DD-metalloendopeptidase family protein, partial [Patescibacteria group bacterium]|nr:peptidoglycan DD-metalloendopeptidase family protein [Patescibacteria group bacterium]